MNSKKKRLRGRSQLHTLLQQLWSDLLHSLSGAAVVKSNAGSDNCNMAISKGGQDTREKRRELDDWVEKGVEKYGVGK